MTKPIGASRASLAAAAIAGLVLAGSVPAAPAPLTREQLGFTGGERLEVLAQCKRVGLIAVVRPAARGVAEEASGRIETAAMKALQLAGFEVAGPDAYSKAYERFNRAVGGIYDPITGAVKRDVFTSVYTNAIREFIGQENLGCVALVRALDVKAKVNDDYASWDGAKEYVDGQANSTITRALLGNQGTGDLSALSIAVQLSNREGKTLYQRSGGVQLVSYLDRHHGTEGSDFLQVPRDQLLLDDKRIERALTYATAPLRFSEDEIAAGSKNPLINTTSLSPADFRPPPAGNPHHDESALKVPREQILGSVHRIILGGIDFAPGLSPPADVVAHYRTLLGERLRKLGWELVEAPGLDAAMGAALKKVGGIYDPLTGKPDTEKLRALMQGSVAAAGVSPAPDAILFPAIVKTLATQKWAIARWDGADQDAETLGAPDLRSGLLKRPGDGRAGEGTMSASSLQLLLRSADGTVLYQSRGGIQLLQQLSVQTQYLGGRFEFKQQFANLAPNELFKDAARDERAVDVALKSLLISPEEIAAEEAAKSKPAKH